MIFREHVKLRLEIYKLTLSHKSDTCAITNVEVLNIPFPGNPDNYKLPACVYICVREIGQIWDNFGNPSEIYSATLTGHSFLP